MIIFIKYLIYFSFIQVIICSNLLNSILSLTNTKIYFILGPNLFRHQNIYNMILKLNISSNFYVLYPGISRNKVTLDSINNLIRSGYIDSNWYEKYILKIHDKKRIPNNLGRLALSLTIHDIFQEFIRLKYTNILLFEDDVMINPLYQNNTDLFIQKFSDYLSLSSNKWDIQYLGFCFECGNKKNYYEKYFLTNLNNYYYEAVFPLCKHAVYMNRYFVEVYLNHSLPFQNNKGDWIFHQIACEYNLKVIRPPNSLFLQNVTIKDSSLGNNNEKNEFAKWISCSIESQKCLNMSKVN